MLARISKIEKYLVEVGGALPAINDDIEFTKYIKGILTSDTTKNRLVRRAFGLPVEIGRSRSLMDIVALRENISAPLISLLAQRIYHFLWRFQFSLDEIDDSHTDKPDLLAKVALLSTICLEYVLAQRPSLLDLDGSISRSIPESAADPSLYTVLRALEYEREEQKALVISASQREAYRRSALEFIYEWLTQALQDKQKVDDPSNAWWALREGLCADSSFVSLVEPTIKKFGAAQAPAAEVIKKSFVPEIYKPDRCAAYIISNIHGIFREGPQLDKNVEKQLDLVLNNMLKTLMASADSKNLYLASVHYEGLSCALSFSPEKQFRTMRDKGQIDLADFRPIGDFVCVDLDITRKIRQLKDWLTSVSGKKGRGAILCYGSSSTGKSFLIEQFFKEFGQADQFEVNRLICQPETTVDDIKKLMTETATRDSGASIPFILLDEFDVEMRRSLYPSLLALLEKGSLGKTADSNGFVLFLAGGKHGSVEALREFLVTNQKKPKFQKGIDVYNRIAPGQKIGLPADLYRNKNLRMMVGLSVLLRHFGSPITVSMSVLLFIREMQVDQGEGVRQFNSLKDDVVKDSEGILVLRSEPDPKKPIRVTLGR